MNSRLTIIMLALSLIFLCAKNAVSDFTSKDSDVPADSSSVQANVIYDAIMKRASVRDFQQKEVSEGMIDSLLKAGMAAPSAMDKRPWHFIVVTDKEMLGKIAKATPNARMAENAPLAIVVCGDMRKAAEGWEKDYWIQDVSAASENILLAAEAMGLGAVWTGTWPSKDRVKAVSELLETPEYIVPLSTIVIGYPAKPVHPKNKFLEENVSYDSYEGD